MAVLPACLSSLVFEHVAGMSVGEWDIGQLEQRNRDEITTHIIELFEFHSTQMDPNWSNLLRNAGTRHSTLKYITTRSSQTLRGYGHQVVSTCDYCRSFNEFGMFALPQALLSYIWAAAVIGIITVNNSGRERYRTLAVAAVAGAFYLEAYYIATAPIEIPKDDRKVFMWHDNFLLLRRLLFLLLPPARAHAPTFCTAMRLQLLHLSRTAVMRVPALRTRAADAREGEWTCALRILASVK
ncbi:hypothetical protein GGX14DRAFT_593529 [Mycena pura]|uniref:Uncharacterized protein n=1 Tax=Mycena pura TaxID=153505 RepID=A0AAD6UYE6_9AGAR|nr:hypothetical protein GGX14DRAFT_593529 [Mycena pura]